MRKTALFFVLAACSTAAVFVFQPHAKEAELHDLTWSVRDGVVTFEFLVTNPTEDKIVVIVELVAERKHEEKWGPKITELGYRRIETPLGAMEGKRQQGQMKLVTAAIGDLTVFPYVTVRKSILGSAPVSVSKSQ